MARLQSQPRHGEYWRVASAEWLAHDNRSLEKASSARLRKMILLGGPESEILFPRQNRVRNEILKAYRECQKNVPEILQTSISKITLSMDTRSAANNLKTLGVVVHLIDEHRYPCRSLIGLWGLPKDRGGPELALTIADLIDQIYINNRLRYFQIENAANSGITPQRIVIDGREQRLCCFGQLVKLVVKTLLFGGSLARLTMEMKNASDVCTFVFWRSKGSDRVDLIGYEPRPLNLW